MLHVHSMDSYVHLLLYITWSSLKLFHTYFRMMAFKICNWSKSKQPTYWIAGTNNTQVSLNVHSKHVNLLHRHIGRSSFINVDSSY